MNRSVAQKIFLCAVVVLAATTLAGGILYLLGHLSVDVGGTPMRIGVGMALIASALALLAGTWATRHSRRRGGGLIAAGAVPAAICFWWTGVVPAVALPVAFFGIRRARRHAVRSDS